MSGSIYLLREREFILLDKQIYKVGRTSQMIGKRLIGYPKDSELIMCLKVKDNKISERKILDNFKLKFNQRLDIGVEYFEGNLHEMICEMSKNINCGEITHQITNEYVTNIDEYRNKIFNVNVMHNLFKIDIKYFGVRYCDEYRITNSYLYFNHYHFFVMTENKYTHSI